MLTLLKILFTLAIIVPAVLLVALLGGVLLAVVLGIAGAVIGLAFFLLKAALFVVLPVLFAIWVFNRIFGHGHCHRESHEWV